MTLRRASLPDQGTRSRAHGKPTIADIAREARVSLATVSRVINEKDEGVGAETRRRVREIIERLDYEPSAAARGLATGRSRSIGMILPDIADPFFSTLVKGVELALGSRGYGFFLCDSDRDLEKEQRHVRLLLEKRVDGVILDSTTSETIEHLDAFDRHAVPYVLLDRVVKGRHGAAGVYADNRRGAAAAARLLLEGGARRLLYVDGPAGLAVSKLRWAGVEDAFRRAGLDPETILRGQGDFSVGSGRAAAERFLGASTRRLPFDAVFAANDRMAIGAMQALRQRGVRIPEDVEIVGFDDIELAALVDPPLTTVAQPAFEMGRRSAELLVQLAEGKKLKKRELVLETRLVVRESTRRRG